MLLEEWEESNMSSTLYRVITLPDATARSRPSGRHAAAVRAVTVSGVVVVAVVVVSAVVRVPPSTAATMVESFSHETVRCNQMVVVLSVLVLVLESAVVLAVLVLEVKPKTNRSMEGQRRQVRMATVDQRRRD
jgi:hypothetical protein